MTSTHNERSGGLAGAGFLALGLLGTVVQSGRPGFTAQPSELVAHYTGDTDTILAGSTLYVIGAILLLWFVSALRARVQEGAGAGQTLPAVAYAGGVAGATLCIAAASVEIVGALGAEERGAIDPAVATALADLSAILYGLAAPAAFAALVLATAVAALRLGALPRWLGFVSVPLGIALAIPPISYIAIVVFTFWAGLVGAVLAFAPARAAASAPAGRAAPA